MAPSSPSVPSRRRTSGFSEAAISSTFSEVTPYSSAAMSAFSVQRTTSRPLVVALAHERAERLLGDDLRQDDEVGGVLVGRAAGREARGVGGVGVAGAGQELLVVPRHSSAIGTGW